MKINRAVLVSILIGMAILGLTGSILLVLILPASNLSSLGIVVPGILVILGLLIGTSLGVINNNSGPVMTMEEKAAKIVALKKRLSIRALISVGCRNAICGGVIFGVWKTWPIDGHINTTILVGILYGLLFGIFAILLDFLRTLRVLSELTSDKDTDNWRMNLKTGVFIFLGLAVVLFLLISVFLFTENLSGHS